MTRCAKLTIDRAVACGQRVEAFFKNPFADLQPRDRAVEIEKRVIKDRASSENAGSPRRREFALLLHGLVQPSGGRVSGWRFPKLMPTRIRSTA